MTVSPANPGVVPGGTLQFAASVTGVADGSVTWSVQEGGTGGSISPSGLYAAPGVPGVFHVVATSVASPSSQGSTTAYVVAPAACTPPSPQPSALPSAQVQELGVHAVGETVTFQVPAGTGSVTLVQQGTQPLAAQTVTIRGTSYPNTVVPAVIQVNGATYYLQSAAPPADPSGWGSPNGVGSMFFEAPAPWTGTITVPNTSNALQYVAANGGVPSGTWAVQVYDYAKGCRLPSCTVGDGISRYPPGSYDLKVLLKPGPVGAAGVVDVNVYLVTDQYTKATAEADPSMARMLGTLGTFLGRAGLSVGAVAFFDLPATVKAQYTTVNIDDATACGEVSQVLGLAGPGNGMNLFLVNSLTSGSQSAGTTVIGLDGTIPGPSSVGGTVASGALVSVANLPVGAGTSACAGAPNLPGCGADFTAYIAAHESGHALGLYHDTEWTGTFFDPVKDTPTCPCSLCATDTSKCDTGSQASTSYQMTNADCTKSAVNPASPCGGGDNLMFWLVSKTLSAGTFTPQQASIMRANPLVR